MAGGDETNQKGLSFNFCFKVGIGIGGSGKDGNLKSLCIGIGGGDMGMCAVEGVGVDIIDRITEKK